MPELYLFGAIILGILLALFWVIVVIATFVNNAFEKSETSWMENERKEKKEMKKEVYKEKYKEGERIESIRLSSSHSRLTVNSQEYILRDSSNLIIGRIKLELYNDGTEGMYIQRSYFHNREIPVPHDSVKESAKYNAYILNLFQEELHDGTISNSNMEELSTAIRHIELQNFYQKNRKIQVYKGQEQDYFVWLA